MTYIKREREVKMAYLVWEWPKCHVGLDEVTGVQLSLRGGGEGGNFDWRRKRIMRTIIFVENKLTNHDFYD